MSGQWNYDSNKGSLKDNNSYIENETTDEYWNNYGLSYTINLLAIILGGVVK